MFSYDANIENIRCKNNFAISSNNDSHGHVLSVHYKAMQYNTAMIKIIKPIIKNFKPACTPAWLPAILTICG